MAAEEERCSPLVVPLLQQDNVSTISSLSSTSLQQFLFFDDVATFSSTPKLPTMNWSNAAAQTSTEKLIEEALYRIVIVAVCVIGLICNIFNLVVLSRKSLTATMERLERSAHYGLVGLAISDALFCVSVLPRAYIGAAVFGFRHYDFRIIYTAYGDALVNTFIVSSTWLTVAMAISRYVAICHPLHARQIIGQSFAFLSLAGVAVLSVLANLPRFLQQTIVAIPCLEGGHFYYVSMGWLAEHATAQRAYQWTYFVVCILAPFVCLVFCNFNLVKELRRSLRMRFETIGSRTGRSNDSGAANRITLTLIVIVAMYFVLVMPAEIMNFIRVVAVSNRVYVDAYNLAVAVANAFQAINFALNFILYCAVNTHFRQTFVRIVYRAFCCGRHSPAGQAGRRVVGYSSMSHGATCTYRVGIEETRMSVFTPSPSPAGRQRNYNTSDNADDEIVTTAT